MTVKDAKRLLSALKKAGVDDVRVVVPTSEGDTLALRQKLRQAGFLSMIHTTPFSDFDLVVRDADLGSS